MTRTPVIAARRQGDLWRITLERDGAETHTTARMLVNAAGPWVGEVLHDRVHVEARETVRLVRGSHIVTRKLFDHDRCYFLQGGDGRIIFAIPYEGDFTLIGTTDVDHDDPGIPPVCSPEEQAYLLAFASAYFARPVTEADVVWTYSGVRPLYDDGARSATAATRDYVLTLDEAGAPLLNVFGGKITTHRRLAEAAMARARPFFAAMGGDWTAGAPLPGGDFAVDGAEALIAGLQADFRFLDAAQARRLVRAYGTEARALLAGARRREDLGEEFGAGITARELDWTVAREWVRTGEDFVWRRSRAGLRLTPAQIERIDAHVRQAARQA
jgi:glycerol-3-phosphate dehydrogenase